MAAMLTSPELESISKSFHESLDSRLWGLSPASISLRWFSSTVKAIAFAHSAARSLIYQVGLDDGDSLSSWYSGDSLKVLDICSCISAEVERLCLRRPNLRNAIKLLFRLDGNPSEEEIHQARDLLAGWAGQGGDGRATSAGDVEGLIRDLAASTGMSEPQGKISPAARVVGRAIHAVSFVTAFLGGVITSALGFSSREIVNMPVPEDFPWSDAVLAIQAAVAVDSDFSYGTGMQAQILKEIHDLEGRVRELYDVEVRVWSALETIEDVAALGGGGEIAGSLREAAIELDKATEAMSEWLYRLTEGVNELVLTVTRMRKEVIDEFTASARKRPSTSA
ncbi:hypothetical protein ACJRO7_004713 [Eucalyptus globulus]|uniref:Uncharacterized protein n=1 Tax=Eucalyptus globulus TaxID=34317 RepID=A0ABD3IXK3_EUCGL